MRIRINEEMDEKGIITKDALREVEVDPEEHPSEYVFMEEDGHWSLSSWGGDKFPLWTTLPISRAEVKKIIPLQSLLKELTEEEKKSLFRASFEDLVGEVFHLHKMSLKEIERWAEDCYLLEINPLPYLRKLLKGVCEDVRYTCTYPTCFSLQEGEKIVVCCHDNEDGSVCIRAYMGN